jgi:hypothetical protein
VTQKVLPFIYIYPTGGCESYCIWFGIDRLTERVGPVICILFVISAGDGLNAQSRVKRLHEILDAGALDAFGGFGIVKAERPDSPLSPFEMQITHPRFLFPFQ